MNIEAGKLVNNQGNCIQNTSLKDNAASGSLSGRVFVALGNGDILDATASDDVFTEKTQSLSYETKSIVWNSLKFVRATIKEQQQKPPQKVEEAAAPPLKARTKWISPETVQKFKTAAKVVAVGLAVLAVLALLIAGGVMAHSGIGIPLLVIGGSAAAAGLAWAKSDMGPFWSPTKNYGGGGSNRNGGYLGSWNDAYTE